MEKIQVEKVNEVYVRLITEPGIRMELSEYFSAYIPNRWFNPKVKRKMWDGKIKYFDTKNSLLPIGLIPKLYEFCKEFSYELDFLFSPDSLFHKDFQEEQYSKFLEYLFTDITPHEHQEEIIFEAITKKRGIVISPTSSGKSLVIYSLMRYFLASKKKALLIVPSTLLVDQMYGDFKEYGWKTAQNHVTLMYSGLKPDFSKEILITTWQSLIKKDKSFFDQYDAVVIDEVHLASGASINTICKQLVYAQYRIGLTGTMPKEAVDRLSITGYLGPIIYTKITGDLIEKGIISKINIANILIKYPPEICNTIKGRPYAEEVRFVEEYSKRNAVFKYIVKQTSKDQNILILINHLKHIDHVKKYLIEQFGHERTILEISGNVSNDERNEVKKRMENESGIITVATYSTMSTGVSIKRIHYVILGSSSRSKTRVLQTIGRGLRKHPTKNSVIVADCIDDLTIENRNGNLNKNHLFKHFEERKTYYDEQGFPNKTAKFVIE